MKKIRVLILAIFLTIFLVGCGKVNLTTVTEINKDGTGFIMGKIKYDKYVSKVIDPILSNEKDISSQGFQVKRYDEDNMKVIEYKYTLFNFEKVHNRENIKQYIDLQEKITPGILKNKVALNIKVNKNILKDALAQVSKENYNLLTGQVSKVVRDIDYENVIKVPGAILESNSTEIVNSNTAKWKYKLSDIEDGTEMTIVYEQPQYPYIILLYLGAIIILIAIVSYVYIRKKHDKKTC